MRQVPRCLEARSLRGYRETEARRLIEDASAAYEAALEGAPDHRARRRRRATPAPGARDSMIEQAHAEPR
jgi:cell division septum initiation protein DivIVA